MSDNPAIKRSEVWFPDGKEHRVGRTAALHHKSPFYAGRDEPKCGVFCAGDGEWICTVADLVNDREEQP